MKGEFGIVGGRVLRQDNAVVLEDILLEDGVIAAIDIGSQANRYIDARGLLVLPGLVDIHGDAFERQLLPRPEAAFPIDIALADTDRQLLANGITTAFHGITLSWEGGLRGRDMAWNLIEHLTHKNGYGADNRIHLRFENHNLEAVDEVLTWMERGLIDVLGFNDHFPGMLEKSEQSDKISKYAERSGRSVADFKTLLAQVAERSNEVPQAVERLAGAARRLGVTTLSHDDMTRADRARYQSLGCDIAEFPMRREAVLAAREFGNAVIMGAPNVVRGGSHLGGTRAADMVADGLCTVLASDYYYPALLAAPFRLAAEGVAAFAAAWSIVSRNPARAAGLADRGEIAVGLRGDLVLVDDSDPQLPKVVATFVGGVPRYIARALPAR